MPHIRIEHSLDIKEIINIKALSLALHQSLASQKTVDPESVKTRNYESENSLVGTSSNSFIHIEVALLSGRPSELKEKMAKDIYDLITKEAPHTDTSISVEVRELQVYFKG